MASGINVDKINELKVELLDYIEGVNSISNRFTNAIDSIKNNIDGLGKDEIIQKLNSINEQFPKISSNINAYIEDLGKANLLYEIRDEEVASNLMNNISRLEEERSE